MSRASKLRRIQDLFVTGKVIELAGEGSEVLRLFVAKPSSFERDEAVKDGRAGRARRVLAFDADEGEQATVSARIVDVGRDGIINALVESKGNDFYTQADEDLRADKAWQDKLLVLQRSESLIRDAAGADDLDEDARSRLGDELEQVRQLNLEYLREVEARLDRLAADYRAELQDRQDDWLGKEYRSTWREMAGSQSFMAERRITEFYFAIRDGECKPDDTKPDGYDHAKCNSHLTRLAEHRHEVYAFPDTLLRAAREALDDLSMPPADAAFSDAPTSSSASSEQPSEAAESMPSTPTETSPEPAGT